MNNYLKNSEKLVLNFLIVENRKIIIFKFYVYLLIKLIKT